MRYLATGVFLKAKEVEGRKVLSALEPRGAQSQSSIARFASERLAVWNHGDWIGVRGVGAAGECGGRREERGGGWCSAEEGMSSLANLIV